MTSLWKYSSHMPGGSHFISSTKSQMSWASDLRRCRITHDPITLATSSSGKRNVTVWRPSVCPSVPSAYSSWLIKGSMRRDQRTFRPDGNYRGPIYLWFCRSYTMTVRLLYQLYELYGWIDVVLEVTGQPAYPSHPQTGDCRPTI